MRLAASIAALLLVPNFASAQQPDRHGYVPPNGFVPDSTTAVRIAVAVWTPIYGDSQFVSQQTITVTLSDHIWTVTTVPRMHELSPGPGFHMLINGMSVLSGSFDMDVMKNVMKIDKRDGRILYMGHS